jgi:hypothetical protein
MSSRQPIIGTEVWGVFQTCISSERLEDFVGASTRNQNEVSARNLNPGLVQRQTSSGGQPIGDFATFMAYPEDKRHCNKAAKNCRIQGCRCLLLSVLWDCHSALSLRNLEESSLVTWELDLTGQILEPSPALPLAPSVSAHPIAFAITVHTITYAITAQQLGSLIPTTSQTPTCPRQSPFKPANPNSHRLRQRILENPCLSEHDRAVLQSVTFPGAFRLGFKSWSVWVRDGDSGIPVPFCWSGMGPECAPSVPNPFITGPNWASPIPVNPRTRRTDMYGQDPIPVPSRPSHHRPGMVRVTPESIIVKPIMVGNGSRAIPVKERTIQCRSRKV